MKKENWILLPTKEFLPNGFYLFKCKHPINGKESEVTHEVTNGLHGFAYAYKCKPISKSK